MAKSPKPSSATDQAAPPPKMTARTSRRLKRESGKALMVEKKRVRRERQEGNRKLREELGDAAPLPATRTIENTREYDVTMVDPAGDAEVVHDECTDEMAAYFDRQRQPKVLITMSPSARLVSGNSMA